MEFEGKNNKRKLKCVLNESQTNEIFEIISKK